LKKNGKNFQQTTIRKKDKNGRKKKINFLLKNKIGKFFKTNFKPSLIGCKIPPPLAFFGPLRFWEYLKIFRSTRVNKGIEIKSVKIKKINLIN